jgi:hypothetical protein
MNALFHVAGSGFDLPGSGCRLQLSLGKLSKMIRLGRAPTVEQWYVFRMSRPAVASTGCAAVRSLAPHQRTIGIFNDGPVAVVTQVLAGAASGETSTFTERASTCTVVRVRVQSGCFSCVLRSRLHGLPGAGGTRKVAGCSAALNTINRESASSSAPVQAR